MVRKYRLRRVWINAQFVFIFSARLGIRIFVPFVIRSHRVILYPNCKINLGLHVLEKRADGFHTIETVFYPVGWEDMLEVLPDHSKEHGVDFSYSGIPIPGDAKDNLCVKAYEL